MRVVGEEQHQEILSILDQVTDPEVPVLTILDLGIVREIEEREGSYVITITPTYSGCPAMGMIEENIISHMRANGYPDVEVKTILTPAWTTDWISENGKRKLKRYGIAPPLDNTEDKSVLFGEQRKIQCPKCNSYNTEMVSQFGSTACKALYKCIDCKEPFDYFKCL